MTTSTTKTPRTSKAKAAAADKAAPAGKGLVVAKRASLPVDVNAFLEQQKNELLNKIGAVAGNAIQVKQNKTMHLPDGRILASNELLNVVILGFVSRNSYYEGAYDPKNIQPPLCFAVGAQPENLIATDASPEKQADSCGSCPMNQWGSAATGEGKACKNTRYLVVTPEEALESPDGEMPMWTLAISPTGIKHFDAYVRTLASKNGLLPLQVVTNIGFDPSSDYPSLRFAPKLAIDNGALGPIIGAQDEVNEILFKEPDFTAIAAAPAAKKPAPRRAAGGRR